MVGRRLTLWVRKAVRRATARTPVGRSRGEGQARSHGRQPAGTAFAYPQNTHKTPLRNARELLFTSVGRSFVCGQEVRVFVLAVGLGTHGQPFRQLEHTGKSLDTQPKV